MTSLTENQLININQRYSFQNNSSHGPQNHQFTARSQQSQTRIKINQFRLQIRSNQISQYMKKIREQSLRIISIEKLLQDYPFDNHSTQFWATQLSQLYSQTYKYRLPQHKLIQIFKMVQKFPNYLTLQLFELVIARADYEAINDLFQYDIMRLLHGFINFTGNIKQYNEIINFKTSIEEQQILKEVIITSAVDHIQLNSPHFTSYRDRLLLARTTVRTISQICRKSNYARNFAVLSHKTYTYCLKLYKCFGKCIELQFFMLLEAITVHHFNNNGIDQVDRISSKIISLFLKEINIKIQLLDERDERSQIKSYQYLIKAVTNLFRVNSQWINIHLIQRDNQPIIIQKIINIFCQCNFVIDYPALKQDKQSTIPIRLYYTTIYMYMNVIQFFQRNGPREEIVYRANFQLSKFLKHTTLGLHSIDFIQARRAICFVLSNFFAEKRNQSQIQKIIFKATPQQNLISSLAQLFMNERQKFNTIQLCYLLSNMFRNQSITIIEPSLSLYQLINIIMERIVQIQIWRSTDIVLTDMDVLQHMINVIADFFNYFGRLIGQRILYYRDLIVHQYKQKLEQMISNQHCTPYFEAKVEQIFSILKQLQNY